MLEGIVVEKELIRSNANVVAEKGLREVGQHAIAEADDDTVADDLNGFDWLFQVRSPGMQMGSFLLFSASKHQSG